MSANSTERHQVRIEARAAFSAYLMLSGIWFALAVFWLMIGFKRPGSGWLAPFILAFSAGLAFVFFLRGFRLRVTSDRFEYRDGFYRTTIISLSDITEARHTWVEPADGGRKFEMPRLVIKFGPDSKQILVNSKPFRRQDIQNVIHALQENTNQK